MEKVSKKQNFSSKVYNIEKINPFFSKVKIYVMYEGFNRNGSYLDRNAINKAIPTIYNIPLVGEFLANEQNFGGHGANVVKNDDGQYELTLSTRPYGLVPESAQIYWEVVQEEDGTEREYLVVDGALLWTARYPELYTILDEGYYGQSMEIELINAKYSIVEGQEVLNIQDFIFTAFCLLGIDKDSDMFGHVPPAFESSKVVAYSLDKDSFTSQFNQMVDELKFTLTEGGNSQMEDTKQFEDAQEDLKKRLENAPSTTVEDADAEKPTEPLTPLEPATPVDPPVDPNPDGDGNDGSEEGTEGSKDGDTPPAEPTTPESETPVVDGSDGSTEGATDGDGATDGGATFSVTEEEYSTLKANFEALEAKVTELSTYKRNRELGDLKDKFSAQISEQELNTVFEANPDTPIENLEVEIFALIGKKNYSLDPKPKQNNKVTVVSPKVTNEASQNPYGDIFN